MNIPRFFGSPTHPQRWFILTAMLGILVAINACSPPKFPLQITDISVNPDPVIGQTATLHVEVMSTEDEPDTSIYVLLPKGVRLVEGQDSWKGSLKANEPQTLDLGICVLYDGDWRIEVIATSILSEDSSYSDIDTLHLIVSAKTATVVSGGEYRYAQPQQKGPLLAPIPLPPGWDTVCPDKLNDKR
jgi:hypothetical protein